MPISADGPKAMTSSLQQRGAAFESATSESGGMAQHLMIPYIKQAGFAYAMPHAAGAAHRLPDYLLLHVQAGACVVTVSGKPHQLQAGDYGIVQPEELLELQPTTDALIPYVHLDILSYPPCEQHGSVEHARTQECAVRHLRPIRLPDGLPVAFPTRLHPSDPIRFHETFRKVIHLWQNGHPLSRLEAHLLATELVLMMLHDHFEWGNLPEGITTRDEGLHSLAWVPSYLSLRLGERISVADMAEYAHLSVSRFSAVFRQQFGISPYQYLLRLRLLHARRLLRTNGLSLQQIAESCGFASVPHFSKAFKKAMGYAPSVSRTRQLPANPRHGVLPDDDCGCHGEHSASKLD